MEREKREIELRSEKDRNVIGQIPPVLLRYGISIIGLSLLMLICILAFIPYQPSIETEITVTQTTSGTLHYTAKIPQNTIKSKMEFTKIKLETSEEFLLPKYYQIDNIFDVVEISENGTWQTATLSPIDIASDKILLTSPIKLSGKILLEKQSVMKWLILTISISVGEF